MERPPYHRRNDLKRLKELVLDLPLLVSDERWALSSTYRFTVRMVGDEPGVAALIAGRYEVVHAYLTGWRDARVRLGFMS